MALNTLGESNEITLRWIASIVVTREMNWQINLQREVLTMTELLGSNSPCHAASVTHRTKEKDYSELDRVLQAEPS